MKENCVSDQTCDDHWVSGKEGKEATGHAWGDECFGDTDETFRFGVGQSTESDGAGKGSEVDENHGGQRLWKWKCTNLVWYIWYAAFLAILTYLSIESVSEVWKEPRRPFLEVSSDSRPWPGDPPRPDLHRLNLHRVIFTIVIVVTLGSTGKFTNYIIFIAGEAIYFSRLLGFLIFKLGWPPGGRQDYRFVIDHDPRLPSKSNLQH